MKQKKSNTGGIIIIVCIIAVAIILLIFGMQGKTTITGGYPDPVSNSSLSCKSEGISYPIATYDNSTKKTLDIDAIFRNNLIDSISLKYTLYYENNADIIGSEAHNHAAMNKSFYQNGLNTDEFNLHLQKHEDRMAMSLYAAKADLANNAARKYFILEQDTSTITDIKSAYEKQGFVCNINN